ncbi:hypothetical protein [Bradyrhizobium genosp. A]|uniref:hypothetical protein n=1 Tax=Bradyrhizobium genosp. A TaxID=83626 RepID=UPI003CECCEF4
MKRSATTVTPEMTAADLLHLFITTKVGVYPVESKGRLGRDRLESRCIDGFVPSQAASCRTT